jgi:quinol monooxygenase YgiN
MAGVRLVIQFTAESPEEAEQRVQALAERCKKVQEEPGCIQFEAFRSELRPNVYALLEHWESDAALDQHLAAMGGRPQQAPGTTRERYQYQTMQ